MKLSMHSNNPDTNHSIYPGFIEFLPGC